MCKSSVAVAYYTNMFRNSSFHYAFLPSSFSLRQKSKNLFASEIFGNKTHTMASNIIIATATKKPSIKKNNELRLISITTIIEFKDIKFKSLYEYELLWACLK